jgi:small subunit ribosomal protein S1
MLDEGYWQSLLEEVENETETPHCVSRHDNVGASAETAAAQRLPRRAPGPFPPVEEAADWARAEELLSSGESFEARIVGYNRGGLLSDFGRIQAFLPASHLLCPPQAQEGEERLAGLAERVGEMLTVRVAEIERDRRRLILSERLVGANGRASDLLGSLLPGQVHCGQVTNLCHFGAFVDLGGFEGLVHISELSWGRIGTPDEVVHPGDPVEVMVLEVNPQEQKVALSLKRLRPDPWRGVDTRYTPGQVVEAIVTNVVNFGAFARLEEGLEGLIHVSELAEGNFTHPRNVIHEGDRVRARVIQVDPSKRRIALTLRGTDGFGA